MIMRKLPFLFIAALIPTLSQAVEAVRNPDDFSLAVLAQPVPEMQPEPEGGAQIETQAPPPTKPEPVLNNNWTIGFGPARANRMGLGNVLYGFDAGRLWDLNQQLALKVQGEANFATRGENGQFLNISMGPLFFLNPERTLPYIQADVGYGQATTNYSQSIDGVSLGTSVGYQFFRQMGRSADIQIRYATVTNPTTEGVPSILAARFALNF
jgi:hypothetical protein